MTTEPRNSTRFKAMVPDPEEDVEPHGVMLIIVPLIFGAAVIIAFLLLWHSESTKSELSRIALMEEEARDYLNDAYQAVRARNPEKALALTAATGERLDQFQSRRKGAYMELKVVRLLIEGEAQMQLDSRRFAAESERKFTDALDHMTTSSGELWSFGMFGRARARFENDDYHGAIEDLDALLSRNPSFGAAYYWRSLGHAGLGDSLQAAVDEEKARILDSWPPLRDFMVGRDRSWRNVSLPDKREE
ncbi:MAG: hypothetical protein LIP23_01310 [Planctomycetes bacterium]|nr:hypothetical protein [Planctomycetota bacterium]